MVNRSIFFSNGAKNSIQINFIKFGLRMHEINVEWRNEEAVCVN